MPYQDTAGEFEEKKVVHITPLVSNTLVGARYLEGFSTLAICRLLVFYYSFSGVRYSIEVHLQSVSRTDTKL